MIPVVTTDISVTPCPAHTTQNCSLKMDDLVDINTIVSFQWTKDEMIIQENSRVTINFTTISSLEYVSSLSIEYNR